MRAAKIDCTALLACLVSVFADPRWSPEISTRAHLQDSALLVHRLPEDSAARGRPSAHPAHLVAGARFGPRPPRPLARQRHLPLGEVEHLAQALLGVPLVEVLAPALLGAPLASLLQVAAPLASLLQVVLVQPLGFLALQQGVRLVRQLGVRLVRHKLVDSGAALVAAAPLAPSPRLVLDLELLQQGVRLALRPGVGLVPLQPAALANRRRRLAPLQPAAHLAALASSSSSSSPRRRCNRSSRKHSSRHQAQVGWLMYRAIPTATSR